MPPMRVVASGSYSPGNAIAFNGGQVVVSGVPAAGDTFVIAPAGRESMFDTLDELVVALETSSRRSLRRVRNFSTGRQCGAHAAGPGA